VCLVALALFALGGCAGSDQAAAKPAAKKKHYIFLPPETGSRIARRVEVDEDGRIVGDTGSVNNVQSYSGQALQNGKPVNATGPRGN
jgi:hypothetical protein